MVQREHHFRHYGVVPSDIVMPSALIGAVDAEGRSIFAGRAVNCFTNAEGSLDPLVSANSHS